MVKRRPFGSFVLLLPFNRKFREEKKIIETLERETRWFSTSRRDRRPGTTPYSWDSTSMRTRSSSNTDSPKIFGNFVYLYGFFLAFDLVGRS